MNKPLTPEQVQAIAQEARGIFSDTRGLLQPQEIQIAVTDLGLLSQTQQPEQIRLALRTVQGHLRNVLRARVSDPRIQARIDACSSHIQQLLSPTSPPPPQGQGTQVPRRPSPPPSQALPPRIPSGQTTVPHREVMAIPGKPTEDAGEMTMAFDVVMPTSEQPPKHETVVLPEKSPPAREPKKARNAQPPERTKRDASPSPEARRKSPPPRAQSSAPHGLVSEEADIFPVVSPPPVALPALSVREELGRTHYKTMPVSPAMTLASPPPTPETGPVFEAAPQVYQALFATAVYVLRRHRSPQDLVAELQRSGALTFDDQGRASTAHLELCKHLNDKLDFTEVDELIADTLEKELQVLDKGFSPKFKELIRRQQLGYLGTTAAAELREKGVELTRRIGAGGMGAVLLGRQLEEDRDVAVKIVTQPGRNPRREVQVAAKFDQKDPVVLVYAGGMIEKYPYSVMAYLPGVRDLHDLPKSLDMNARLVACYGMAKSISAIHGKKVLHKDIKPANFLTRNLKNADLPTLLKEVEVYGSDFGLARSFDQPELDDPNAIEGTPFFMSPEQASLKTLTPASDVFSLGISMYNVLTGAMPYDMKEVTTQGQLLNHIRTLKSSPIKRNAPKLKEVPAELVDLLIRMTDPKPEKRPDATEVEQGFERYFSGEQSKWTRRAFWGLGGVAALGVAALAAMPFVSKSNRRDEFQKTQEQTLRSAAEAVTARNWQNAITLLDAEEARIIANEDLSGSERQAQLETVREKLRVARDGLAAQQREQREAAELAERERREAATRADRLISEGDAFLTQQNFSGARAKYDQALAASAERAEQVRERRERANLEEITAVFSQGVRSYHTGELGQTAQAFRRLESRELSTGLSADQRARIAEMRRVSDGWLPMRGRADVAALNALGWSYEGEGEDRQINSNSIPQQGIDLQAWARTVLSWKAEALEGNDQSLAQIMFTFQRLQQGVALLEEANASDSRFAREVQRLTTMAQLFSTDGMAFLRYADRRPGFLLSLENHLDYAVNHFLDRIELLDRPEATQGDAQKRAMRRELILHAIRSAAALLRTPEGDRCIDPAKVNRLMVRLETNWRSIILSLSLADNAAAQALQNEARAIPGVGGEGRLSEIISRR